MTGIDFLRDLASSAGVEDRQTYAPERLRFVLEALRPGEDPDQAKAALAGEIAALIGENTFDPSRYSGSPSRTASSSSCWPCAASTERCRPNGSSPSRPTCGTR
ncbi:hypothetical protein AJ88_15630 [Mesorhizobium amorphae CCBAU 01583]|nr:hypothetical protein AJ88_15630 [Mesorhizobium amorphae CCBAU 01583]